MDKQTINIYKETIKQWGEPLQFDIAIEELAELIVALQHYRRFDQRHDCKEIIDEISDVEIMIGQLKYMLDINSLSIFEVKQKKLARLKKLLNLCPDETDEAVRDDAQEY